MDGGEWARKTTTVMPNRRSQWGILLFIYEDNMCRLVEGEARGDVDVV